MKNIKSIIVLGILFTILSCNKSQCHECHYEDVSGQEVELGEKCDSDLENLESNGITVADSLYEVHCHEH
jgi:hypothetical protein